MTKTQLTASSPKKESVSKSARIGRSQKQSDARSKQARVITMLRSPSGATVAAIIKATGWQQHSVRGFLAGIVRKRLKLKLESRVVDDKRLYRIHGSAKPSKTKRPPA